MIKKTIYCSLSLILFHSLTLTAQENSLLPSPPNSAINGEEVHSSQSAKPASPKLRANGDEAKLNINYRQTLSFDPYLNGLSPPSVYLDYAVDENSIRVGQSIISNETFKVFLGNPYTLDPNIKYLKDLPAEDILLISIPSALFDTGTVQIISDNGSVEWSAPFTSSQKRLGKRIYGLLNKIYFTTKDRLNVFALPLPITSVPVFSPKRNSPFKFCLQSSTPNETFSRICSPMYKIDQKAKQLKPLVGVDGIRVIIDEINKPLIGIYDITSEDQLIHFFATTGNKFLYEFKAKPQKLWLTDFFRGTNSNVVLIGHTNVPINKNVTVMTPVDESTLTYQMGWQPTMGDLKKYWSVQVPEDNPKLQMAGTGGGEFTYQLKINAVPDKNKLITIDLKSPSSTYSSEIEIKGTVKPQSKVSSQQNEAKVVDPKLGRFVWNFDSSLLGQEQTRSLLLEDESQKTWTANYTVYRGSANELSFRIGGVILPTQQFNILAEATYNHWFEDLFGWNNTHMSVLRWGLSFKEFQPIKSFESKNTTDPSIVFAMRTFDLKYRLTPGIWGRDASWGLLLGLGQVKLNDIQASLLGGGFFWARSMPKVFDDLLNFLPFMNYPKWVDLEFTYFPSSLSKDMKPNTNYLLNFHGKILWTNTFFGEAGFGYRSISYTDVSTGNTPRFRSFYGTAGLGLNF